MKKPRVIYPFLFATFPILFLFSHNIAELSLLEQSSIFRLVFPITIIIGLTGVLWFPLKILFKDAHKAGIAILALLVIFFSYGHFYNGVVKQWEVNILFVIGSFQFGYKKLYLSICAIFVALVMYLLRRTRRNLPLLSYFLNVFTGVLIIISLTKIVTYETKRFLLSRNQTLSAVELNSVAGKTAMVFPDIYYIILDAYAAANTLREDFGYDNHEFLNYLTEKGFYVTSHSYSNYGCTTLSLSSSLNFEYINYLSEQVGELSDDLSVPIHMIENSRIMRFLKAKGYKFVHFKTSYAPTAQNRYADWDVDCERGMFKDRFVQLLVRTTMIDLFLDSSFFEAKRRRVLCQFSTLEQLYTLDEPIFAFAHIIAPHEPYVFDANGEPVSTQESEKFQGNIRFSERGRQLYINQLIFINEQLKQLINRILSNSTIPPIIILQADHGTRISEKNMQAWMRIFNAYYLPQQGNTRLYNSITPVNTFRIIANHYFGMQYDLLDDQCYYSDYYNTPYKFINITRQVQYE